MTFHRYIQNNRLSIDHSTLELLQTLAERNVEIRLSNNTNFDTTCDATLLKWYTPQVSRSIDDRELIR